MNKYLTPYEENRINEIINYLCDEGLSTGLASNHFFSWCKDKRDDFYKKHLCYYTGLTKICFREENLNWVIKVGFDNCKSRSGEIVNYCELEAMNYEKAVCNNLQGFFATMFLFKEIDGIKFFVQEYVTADEDVFTEMFEEYTSDWYDKESYTNEDDYWSDVYESAESLEPDEAVMAVLGEDEYALIEFIRENKINDLHCANWGYTRDGNIVIMDYSGFDMG